MAWWDYGYQINGIANRTTIADGNTWCVSLCMSKGEREREREYPRRV